MVLGLLGILVRDVQANVVQAMNLHLTVDGASHYITWCQAAALVILLHELLAVRQSQDASITAHSLCNEVGRMSFLGIEEHGGVELYELHILHLTLGTIYHGYSVAGGNIGI